MVWTLLSFCADCLTGVLIGGTGGFRPGAVVTTSGTHYAMGGNAMGGAIITGACHVARPAIQGNHACAGGHGVAVKAEPVNRGPIRPAAPVASPAGMLVPDICRAPTACAFNIVGSFNYQGHGAKPRSGGTATLSASDGEHKCRRRLSLSTLIVPPRLPSTML